jgi:GTPase SAR1 family protein
MRCKSCRECPGKIHGHSTILLGCERNEGSKSVKREVRPHTRHRRDLVSFGSPCWPTGPLFSVKSFPSPLSSTRNPANPQVHVQFWEVAFPEIEAAAAGSVTSTNQLQACFSNAHGVIIAYDTSSAMSFLSVDGCLDAVARDWRLAIGPLVLLGCKSDLKATGDASGITDTEIYDYCTAAGYSNWWSCSAKGSRLLCHSLPSCRDSCEFPVADDTASSITNAVAEVVRSAIVSFRLLPVDSPPPPVGVALSSKATRPLKPARRSDGSASIPSFSEWLDSVGFACGSPESFVITARGNGDVTVSKSSRHRVPHNPVCRASMWSSSDDSEFVGKVRDDAVKQVSTIASTLLGQPSLTVLPRITVHTTAAPKQTSMLPPSVVCKTVADILHPVVRKESSFAGVHEEVRVSISNQDGETFLAGVGFPQPLLTPLGDIASYDDDEITLADGESEQLEYRYKVGVSLLTDWFLAFCESCEDQFPVATSGNCFGEDGSG